MLYIRLDEKTGEQKIYKYGVTGRQPLSARPQSQVNELGGEGHASWEEIARVKNRFEALRL
ncbi:MAG: hypothetical protein LWX56_05095 [Ignavibacteria bacterium]|nr:hypothetical protein [Ignavibacteria bacterium]